jgi:hypothetical protein
VPSFSELSDEAKETARNRFRSRDYPFDEWWDSVYEDAVECAKCLGIEISTREGKLRTPEIYFSGFWSQGDGASFFGEYTPRADACAAVAAHTPQDEELKRIAEALTQVQVAADLQYGMQIKGKIGGNYNHLGCVHFDAAFVDEPEEESDVDPGDEAVLRDLFQAFANWIYGRLEEEYEYLRSDEHVDECLQDDEFDEEGNSV